MQRIRRIGAELAGKLVDLLLQFDHAHFAPGRQLIEAAQFIVLAEQTLLRALEGRDVVVVLDPAAGEDAGGDRPARVLEPAGFASLAGEHVAVEALDEGVVVVGGQHLVRKGLRIFEDRREALADELQADADLVEALPLLDENLFVQVNACAAGKFNISVYRYNEETRTLEIDASAPSVNDVPALVEALRDTALFSSIQYSGYTSDTDGVYYCTVGCVLAG